ncbi:Ser/Thr phosphatase [Sphingobacterium olei]|uniref:Ser/Thr phosphatase n=1 Tax=Sphingobacterium olei TaxID=2571155 RepID=A0A4U0P681_9SPHI|nr:calcineurin-like phosphoesterase family protein [Sphingobacterium olei]TJZ62951.1 Ser/Thr phosphatase [Sphingobacterium olei]
MQKAPKVEPPAFICFTHMRKKILYFAILLLLPLFLSAQSPIWLEGAVFLDKNQNGSRDKGERALKHIPVSNGKDIVYTDANGNYRIAVEQGQSVFPILPSGYTIAGDKASRVKNSLFYYITENSTAAQHNEFALTHEEQLTSFRIGAIGDIQVGDATELNYAGKSIFRELASRDDISFHMVLGDLVNDNLDLFTPFKAMLEVMPAPSWTVLGNHDRDIDQANRSDHSFNTEFGASTYAFNYGGVHFIVLNNVFSTGKHSYEGRISDDQLQFLVNDLKNVAPGTQLVICQHIPMAYTRNRTEALGLLDRFSNVLILSGHTHQVGRHFYNGGNVQEIVTGAPSGNWWTGEKNLHGIPDALMQCGSPRNYFTIDFKKSKYAFQFKGIGLDEEQQMDLTLRGDTLITNLYAASDSTTVEFQIDQREWTPMHHVDRPAESVLCVIENNKDKQFPASGNRINPLRKRASPHIWQTIIGALLPGSHTIRIRAFDRFGYTVETTETIFVPPGGNLIVL